MSTQAEQQAALQRPILPCTHEFASNCWPHRPSDTQRYRMKSQPQLVSPARPATRLSRSFTKDGQPFPSLMARPPTFFEGFQPLGQDFDVRLGRRVVDVETRRGDRLRTDARSRRGDMPTPARRARARKLTIFRKGALHRGGNIDGCFGFPRYWTNREQKMAAVRLRLSQCDLSC